MGSGAPKGNTYAVTHGYTTIEVKLFRKQVWQAIKTNRELLKKLS